MLKVNLTLPWPPSANTYWRRNGGRYFISKRGQDYRELVTKECYAFMGSFKENDRLRLQILAFPPDKRKRDLDNICKSLCDSLQYSQVFPDDNQIDEILIKRQANISGKVIVDIEKLEV